MYWWIDVLMDLDTFVIDINIGSDIDTNIDINIDTNIFIDYGIDIIINIKMII